MFMHAYQSLVYTWVCLCVCSVSPLCLSACGPNEGCLQYNERCGQIMEEVITLACSSRWLRITLLIGQMQQHDRPGRDAKMEKGEKSTLKINSSSVWLPIKDEAWGTQVSGKRVCAQTHSHWATSLGREHLQLCKCVVIQTAPVSRQICRLQLSLVKC